MWMQLHFWQFLRIQRTHLPCFRHIIRHIIYYYITHTTLFQLQKSLLLKQIRRWSWRIDKHLEDGGHCIFEGTITEFNWKVAKLHQRADGRAGGMIDYGIHLDIRK
jgi:hypothetical protein